MEKGVEFVYIERYYGLCPLAVDNLPATKCSQTKLNIGFVILVVDTHGDILR